MVLGDSLLFGSGDQYTAVRDNKGTWRILSLWHPDLRNLSSDPNFDIPDDHAAVTVVTEGQFLALIKVATSQGLISGVADSDAIPSEEYDSVCKERDDFRLELDNLKEVNMHKNVSVDNSEVFKIAQKKLDLVEKLASLNQVDAETIKLILQVGGNESIN